MATRNVLLSIALGFVGLYAIPVSACECVSTHVRDRFMGREYVFVGKVSAVNHVELKRLRGRAADFTVSRWFSGGDSPHLTILIDSCADLVPGHEYLVFATCWTEIIANSGCSTVDLETKQGRSDLRALKWRGWLWRLQSRFRGDNPLPGDRSKCAAAANVGRH